MGTRELDRMVQWEGKWYTPVQVLCIHACMDGCSPSRVHGNPGQGRPDLTMYIHHIMPHWLELTFTCNEYSRVTPIRKLAQDSKPQGNRTKCPLQWQAYTTTTSTCDLHMQLNEAINRREVYTQPSHTNQTCKTSQTLLYLVVRRYAQEFVPSGLGILYAITHSYECMS